MGGMTCRIVISDRARQIPASRIRFPARANKSAAAEKKQKIVR